MDPLSTFMALSRASRLLIGNMVWVNIPYVGTWGPWGFVLGTYKLQFRLLASWSYVITL